MNEGDQSHLNLRAGRGVGASPPRKDDARFMTGRGQYVGDIRLPGMPEVAFLRSPVTHGLLRPIVSPRARTF